MEAQGRRWGGAKVTKMKGNTPDLSWNNWHESAILTEADEVTALTVPRPRHNASVEETRMPFEWEIGDSESHFKTRKSIGKRKRFEIFKRDSFTCQYCGAQPPAVILHVDHILAVANGGGNEAENLTTACQDCNLGKSAVPLSIKPKTLESAAEDAEEAADQVREHAKMVREAREAIEDVCWEIAEVLQAGAGQGWSHDKFNGVKGFVNRIGYAKTLESAYIAADRYGEGSRRFKYFCGICWNRFREAAE